jgi:hypothetical protein
LDYNLLNYTNNICIKFLETLKGEEVALNNLYREHVEKNKQSIRNYLKLLEGDYPNNWVMKQKFNIELLRGEGVNPKKINLLEVILDEKYKNISKRLVDDPNYLKDEIQKTKLKLENVTASIKTFEDGLDAVTGNLFKKLNNIDKLKLTNAHNALSNIASNAIYNGVNSQFIGSGIDNICGNVVVDTDNKGLKFMKTPLKYKEGFNKININIFEEKYKKEQELYESYKKTTELLLARIQKHHSYTALINLFIDYYNFVKTYQVDYVYFSTFGDFRGRVYYASSVSPQANPLFRFLYYFGTCDNIPGIIIPDFVQKNTQLLKVFNKESLDVRLVHILFSIGILFKDLIEMKNPAYIDFCDIILMGIAKYKEFIEGPLDKIKVQQFSDIKKILELNYYVNIITSVGCGQYKNYYIIKDTTASFAQHVGIACGFNEDSLKYVNLSNTDGMYDTYHVIINNLKLYLKTYKIKHNSVKENLLLNSIKYFDRKLLKSTIMTINYGIGVKKAFKNFKVLLQDLPDNYFDSDLDNNSKVIKMLESSFYFIFNGLKSGGGFENLYYNDINKVRNALLKNGFAEVDDMVIYNDYYHTVGKHIEIRIYSDEITLNDKKYKRYTLNRFKTTGVSGGDLVKNNDKMETACWVNLIHMLDAKYLRDIINMLYDSGVVSLFSLHDG